MLNRFLEAIGLKKPAKVKPEHPPTRLVVWAPQGKHAATGEAIINLGGILVELNLQGGTARRVYECPTAESAMDCVAYLSNTAERWEMTWKGIRVLPTGAH